VTPSALLIQAARVKNNRGKGPNVFHGLSQKHLLAINSGIIHPFGVHGTTLPYNYKGSMCNN